MVEVVVVVDNEQNPARNDDTSQQAQPGGHITSYTEIRPKIGKQTNLLPEHLVQRFLPLSLAQKRFLLASLLLREALPVPHGALVRSLVSRDSLPKWGTGDAYTWGIRCGACHLLANVVVVDPRNPTLSNYQKSTQHLFGTERLDERRVGVTTAAGTSHVSATSKTVTIFQADKS